MSLKVIKKKRYPFVAPLTTPKHLLSKHSLPPILPTFLHLHLLTRKYTERYMWGEKLKENRIRTVMCSISHCEWANYLYVLSEEGQTQLLLCGTLSKVMKMYSRRCSYWANIDSRGWPLVIIKFCQRLMRRNLTKAGRMRLKSGDWLLTWIRRSRPWQLPCR